MAAVSPALITSSRAALDSALNLLWDDKATRRKEGLKHLSAFLDSIDARRVLDELTLRLRPTDSVTAATWPGLASKLAQFISHELAAAQKKSKQPEAALSHMMRKLVQAAEDDRRSGRRGFLARRAAKLFAHVRDVLDATSLASTSPMGRDYATLLRSQLLAVPEYCAAASPEDFEGLVGCHMNWLGEDQSLAAAEEAHRNLTTLGLLLSNFPGDVPAPLLEDVVNFFAGLGPRLAELPRDVRLGTCALAALTPFLLRNGLDVASVCPQLHAALHAVVLRGLQAWDQRAKDAAVVYLRVQLQLGGVGAEALADTLKWAKRELLRNPPKWGEGSRGQRVRVQPTQDHLLSLLAALYLHCSDIFEAEGAEEDDDDDEIILTMRPAKRARSSPLLTTLGDSAAAQPAVWAPLAARVLLRYGMVLPVETHAEWVQRLVAELPELLPSGHVPEDHSPEGAMWALRYAHALALAAPSANANTGPGAGQQWLQIWDAVTARTRAPGLPAAELDDALWLLACIADRGLAPLPPGFHQLWGVPLLHRQPTPAAARFVEGALRAGADSVAHAGKWEEEALTWLSKEEAALNPVCDAAAVLVAYLRLPPEQLAVSGSGAESEARPPDFSVLLDYGGELPWVWWDGDEEMERRLALLCRGATYMRAKASAVAAAAERERQNAAAAASVGSRAPAGLQMHYRAADVLEKALDTALSAEPTPPQPAHRCAQHASHLAQLLASSASALRIASRAAAAFKKASHPVPDCWLRDASLLTKVRQALQKCAPLLAAACSSLRGIEPLEAASLQQAAAVLLAYQAAVGPADALTAALETALPELQAAFLNAEAAPGPSGATQGAAMGGGEPDAALFDDELDVGGAARPPSGGGSSSAAFSSSASLAAACKARCVAVLHALAPALPAATAHATVELLEEMNLDGGQPPPPALHLSLVAVIVSCTTAALDQNCPQAAAMAESAVAELDEAAGVLSWDAKSGAPFVWLFAMQRAAALAGALAAAAAAGLAEAADGLAAVAHVVGLSMDRCGEGASSSRAERVGLGRAVVALFSADPTLFSDASGHYNRAIHAVASLVVDPCYEARAAGGQLVQKLFEKVADPTLGFKATKATLCLNSTLMDHNGGARMAEHAETAVFFLAETAVGCGVLELDCLLQLAIEAAAAPPQLALIVAAADWVALSLGYPDRHAYAAWHQPALIYSWFVSGGSDLESLVSVRSLVAPSQDAAAGAAAFVGACAPALVATLTQLQDARGLQQLSEILGCTLHQLFKQNLDAVLALGYPGLYSRERNTKRMSVAMFQQGPLFESFKSAREDLMKEMNGSVVEGIGRMMAAARDPAPGQSEPLLPFFTPEVVAAAVMNLPGTADDTPESKAEQLWGMILREDQISSLLLRVQEHLGQASHTRHLSAALGALRAVLQLLGDRVTAAATFRHAVSILLRLLRVPALRAVASVMLQTVVSRAAAGPEGVAALGAMLPALLSTMVEAIGDGQGGREVGQLVALLDGLTVGAPPALRPFLRQVDPLPADIGALAAAAKAVEAQRSGVTAAEQLSQLAGRVASMAPALRRRSLAALRRALGEQASLFDPGGIEGGQLRCRPEVAAAAWRLAVLSNDLADARLAEFAGELLALAGPLDPGVIAFDASAALAAQTQPSASSAAVGGGRGGRSQSQAAGRAAKSRKDRAASAGPGAGSADVQATWVAALRLLCDYLVDEDTGVVRAAQNTLRHLLSTTDGRAALEALEPTTAALVAIFVPAKQPAEQHGSPHSGSSGVEAPDLWQLGGQPYERWVCNLAYAMLHRADSATLFHCSRMAQHKPAFAELLMPLAFADLASQPEPDASASGSPGASQRLARVIATEVLPRGHEHPKAMRLLLRCLNYLRGLHVDAKVVPKPSRTATAIYGVLRAVDAAAWGKVYWVDLDYLQVAAAAERCGAHFTALLYVEAWCESRGKGRLVLPDPAGEPRRGEADALLLGVYSHIEEPDGLYAVARSNELLPQLRRLEREGNWAQALFTSDIAMQLLAEQQQQQQQQQAAGGRGGRQRGAPTVGGLTMEAATASLMRSLSNLGAANLLAAVARGNGAAAEQAAAGLGAWAPLDPGNGEPEPTDTLLAAAVAALAAGSAERCGQALSSARRALVAGLSTAGLEGAGDVNPALVRLQMLQEVSDGWGLKWPQLAHLGAVGSPTQTRRLSTPRAARGMDSAAFDRALQLWRGWEGAAGAGGRYGLLAPLQDLRRQLLRTLGAPAQEADCLAQAAVAARKTGHFGHATASLYRLRAIVEREASLEGGGEDWAQALAAPGAAWRVEEAKLLWAQGQNDSALALARRLLLSCRSDTTGSGSNSGSGSGNAPDGEAGSAYLLTLAAKWMAHTRTEADSTILAMMRSAAEQVTQSAHPCAARILYRLAHYADTLYRSLRGHMSTPEWATAQAVIDFKQKQLAQMEAQFADRKVRGLVKIVGGKYDHDEDKELASNISNTKKTLLLDEAERESQAKREVALRALALGSYGRCLQAGDEYDLPSVFRIVQLWLDLKDDGDVNKRVAVILRSAPSRKFLPLIYQVASRLSAAPAGPLVDSTFQSTLTELLVRLGSDHPHHSLPQVFALRNGNRDKDGRVADVDRAEGGLAHVADVDKVAAAELVLQRVAATSEQSRELIRQLQVATDSYIELAAIPVGRDEVSMPFPAAIRRALITLTRVPVLSVPLPVDPECRYDSVPYVATVVERIKFVGGINKPKLVELVDSDGESRRQLVKSGSDDLRQDAVMQQFFALLNEFLRHDRSAASRLLRIKTYKVVPFSPAAGLLEWVDNTRPLGDYLFGSARGEDPKSALSRHRRPEDLSYSAAYNQLATAAQANPRNAAKLRPVYDAICARFPPVLHHFFLEQFREAGSWFEARLAYTRSVAVNSMAGHIIGLGDRHCSNILIDSVSAEVVHIDLGIAFEQGRLLLTPELVPFRLTRTIVDGMGVTGVEGVMRRCCEETLRVVRSNKESILTVLEVFIHDPLYKWALTLVQAKKRQRESPLGPDYVADGEVEQQPVGGAAGEEGGGGGGGAGVLTGTADAERTLLRIKQKLEGMEGGESGGRGVEGQVQLLLAEAANPDNLCRMYIGWLPFL